MQFCPPLASTGYGSAVPSTAIVTNTPAPLFAARPGRGYIEVENQDPQVSIYLVPPGWSPPSGSGAWTVTDGIALGPGQSRQIPFSGSWWAVVDPAVFNFSVSGSLAGVQVAVVDYY